MDRVYSTSAIEDRALAFAGQIKQLDGSIVVESAAAVYQRLVRHALRQLVATMRAAREIERQTAYDAAPPATQAAVDAQLGVQP